MSLLHRQVVSRMGGQRGLSLPSIAGEVFSAPSLTANVGAVLIVNREEIQARAAPVSTNIQGLDTDIRQNLYYANPDDLRKTADLLEAISKDFPSNIASDYTAKASDLRTQADILETRKTHENASNELSFSQSFFDFEGKWHAFKEKYVDSSPGVFSSDLSGNDILAAIDDYHDQFEGFAKSYHDLGYKESVNLPKSTAGNTKVPDLPNVGNAISSIVPWKPLIVGGLVLGGFALWLNRPRSVSIAK